MSNSAACCRVMCLALLVGILFDRTALWRLHEVLADQDLGVLFGPDISAADFNDDALARSLDKLAKANPEQASGTTSGPEGRLGARCG